MVGGRIKGEDGNPASGAIEQSQCGVCLNRAGAVTEEPGLFDDGSTGQMQRGGQMPSEICPRSQIVGISQVLKCSSGNVNEGDQG